MSSSDDFSIKTGRFSKGLKKSIAKDQWENDSDIDSDSDVEDAFQSLSKHGKGGRDVVDLSHKNSAKFNSLVTQKMTDYPQFIDDELIESMDDAFNQESLSKRQQKTVQRGFDSLEKYKQSTRPMSPTSKKNTEDTMTLFTNKNPDNLRYRDSSENRSVGPYPHPNVKKGQLSPRSERQMDFSAKASKKFSSTVDSDEEDLFSAYNQVTQRIKTEKMSTGDMPQFRKNFNNE